MRIISASPLLSSPGPGPFFLVCFVCFVGVLLSCLCDLLWAIVLFAR